MVQFAFLVSREGVTQLLYLCKFAAKHKYMLISNKLVFFGFRVLFMAIESD